MYIRRGVYVIDKWRRVALIIYSALVVLTKIKYVWWLCFSFKLIQQFTNLFYEIHFDALVLDLLTCKKHQSLFYYKKNPTVYINETKFVWAMPAYLRLAIYLIFSSVDWPDRGRKQQCLKSLTSPVTHKIVLQWFVPFAI